MAEHLNERPYTAVASRSSLDIDTHLGQAKRLQIWRRAEDGGFRLVEERSTPRGCGGAGWEEAVKGLSDSGPSWPRPQATSRAGYLPSTG